MKALSMAISRPEVLIKQLSRNNVGSRSKSSSPIFYTKSHHAAAAAAAAGITAQEPYSPKVTCIGQVRPRKSLRRRRRRLRCWFLSRRRRAFWRSLCKWVVFFKAGYCKKVDAEEDCFSVGRKIEFLSDQNNSNNHSSSPPRNALMLTRSAPYRERIWREKIEERSSETTEESSRVKYENEVAESRIIIGQENLNGGVSENPRNITSIVVEDLEGISVVLEEE